ncbi:hypothetical protein [Pseudofrankia inefficax]|uniref:Helix-turn-helix domain-containing protein n=1 Tax=Pseudofrankia inefficax (strain DSM 45817 / CECT 9037 / DDB 130130 / EuI1c) TaxID=298654 RepID=E3J646_PSEI1|nr:hypothetical protein [Pseudofrankia inefficax]ADP78337.1 hypothetical protein FraEuI1c_0251 [Pseudofrankia inefficax]
MNLASDPLAAATPGGRAEGGRVTAADLDSRRLANLTTPPAPHLTRAEARRIRRAALAELRGRWPIDRLRALPATTDLATAGSILGMAEDKARELARAGDFPAPLIRHGDRYVVPTRPLLALLGIDR